MKSTGEVMGVSDTFEAAYLKGQLGVGHELPLSGKVLLSIGDKEKSRLFPAIETLVELGFELYATSGTADFLKEKGIEVTSLKKMHEEGPHILDFIQNEDVGIVINTPTKERINDERILRDAVLQRQISFVSTIPGMNASVKAIAHAKELGATPDSYSHLKVEALQDMHEKITS